MVPRGLTACHFAQESQHVNDWRPAFRNGRRTSECEPPELGILDRHPVQVGATRDEEYEQLPERVDVGAGVRFGPLELFRRSVAVCAGLLEGTPSDGLSPILGD